RLERRAIPSAAHILDLVEEDRARSITHVPEVGLAAFDFRPGPSEENSLLVRVIVRIVVRYNPAGRREHRMKISSAKETWPNIRTRGFSTQTEIENRPTLSLKVQRALVGDGFDRVCRNALRRSAPHQQRC